MGTPPEETVQVSMEAMAETAQTRATTPRETAIIADDPRAMMKIDRERIRKNGFASVE